jgi:hypothetical protein
MRSCVARDERVSKKPCRPLSHASPDPQFYKRYVHSATEQMVLVQGVDVLRQRREDKETVVKPEMAPLKTRTIQQDAVFQG